MANMKVDNQSPTQQCKHLGWSLASWLAGAGSPISTIKKDPSQKTFKSLWIAWIGKKVFQPPNLLRRVLRKAGGAWAFRRASKTTGSRRPLGRTWDLRFTLRNFVFFFGGGICHFFFFQADEYFFLVVLNSCLCTVQLFNASIEHVPSFFFQKLGKQLVWSPEIAAGSQQNWMIFLFREHFKYVFFFFLE